jgi:hypothetical protein
MTTPTTVQEAIEQNALGPQAVSTPSTSATAHSLLDQIEADRYLAAKAAANANVAGFGVRVQRIVPPGGG